MSARVFAVAALCLMASVVSAQTIISGNTYSEFGCKGTIVRQTNTTVGTCIPSLGGYESSAWYTSASGDAVYQYTFSDRNCTQANVYTITSMPATCTGYQQNVVIRPVAPPAAFPPSGWSMSTSYLNTTNGRQSSTCAAGTNIYVSQSASMLGGCRRVDSAFSTLHYSASYCMAGDANQGGSVAFADAACTTVYNAAIVPINVCKDGRITASCPSGAPTLPTLPTTGYTSFSNDACSGAVESTTLSTSACYASRTFTCGTINGTTMATVATFRDVTNKGLCTDAAISTTSFLADATTCYNGKKYNCAFNPTPVSAASSAVSSFVVMIVAAIVAVFATRSL